MTEKALRPDQVLGPDKTLRLGTRRSKLAMAQSGQVAQAVSELTGRPVELVEITTYGDTSREHLAQIGGTGVFVTALRDALLRGEVDFAVHSLKDLPTSQPDELTLAAVPPREDPRDVLIAGTGSPSRNFRTAPGSVRVRRAGQRSSTRTRATTAASSRRCRSAGTSTPASVTSAVANSTPSCWPRPDCDGSAGSMR